MCNIIVYSILFLLGFILLFNSSFNTRIGNYPNVVSSTHHLLPSYDYIIVGGGTAGCVLGSLLSENTNTSVLMIEAGPQESLLSYIPLLAPVVSLIDPTWNYYSVPQLKSHRGFHDGKSRIIRAKFLGGNGQLNFNIHSRSGIAKDEFIDNDFTLTTNDSSENEIIKHFESLQNQFGEFGEGIFGRVKRTIRNNMRWSSLNHYVEPALKQNRDNFQILINHQVDHLEFRGKVAVSIKFKDKTSIPIPNELILSAGAINTPEILIKSGIGPRQQMKNNKISLIKELPVGETLQDHLTYPLYFHVSNYTKSINLASLMNPREIWKYFKNGSGIYGSSGIASQAYFPKKSILVLLYNIGAPEKILYTQISNMKTSVFKAIFPNSENIFKQGFILLSSCLKLKSKGKVKIGKNGRVEIDPNYFDNPKDLSCFKNAVRLSEKIGNSLTMIGAKAHVPKFHDECPGLVPDFANDEYLECALRTAAMTMYHPTSTTPMGKVVDENFKVYGLNNVYVVDGGVFSSLPDRFPNALIIKMAKNAAQKFKQKQQHQHC